MTRPQRRLAAPEHPFGDPARRGARGVDLHVLPVILILGVFLLHPGAHGAVGERLGLDRAGQPVLLERGLRRPARTTPTVTTGGGLTDAQLRHLACATTPGTCCSSCRCRRRCRCSSPCSSTGAILRGRGFFRTAFYFPSVTSSVAITVLLLFLFSTTGVVNEILVRSVSTDPTGSTIRGASCTSLVGSVGITDGPGGAHRQRLPRAVVVGLARRALGRHDGLHPHGDLHDERHVHAAVPRRAAEHRRRGRARPP